MPEPNEARVNLNETARLLAQISPDRSLAEVTLALVEMVEAYEAGFSRIEAGIAKREVAVCGGS